MGAGVAADLKSSGFDVVSTAEGRSARSRERAEASGVRLLATLGDVVAAADTFLSIVPADQAEPLGDAVAAALHGKPLHFVECNSITPSKTLRIGERLAAAGALVSDGGIIGPPPGTGKMKTRLYVSGPHSGVLGALQSDRMPVIRLGDSLSQATEMKVLFSAANKGATALLANILAAAREVGLLERVMGELDGARPGLLGCVSSSVPDLDDKAQRWAIEMADLAQGLADMGADGDYHKAAGASYQRLADNLARMKPGADPMTRVLTAWTARTTS
jgi:3-hydroxyisobutyrate dehydrogenase-like beta-hydroxyacid dehydrogenase